MQWLGQSIRLEVDFARQAMRGSTTLTFQLTSSPPLVQVVECELETHLPGQQQPNKHLVPLDSLLPRRSKAGTGAHDDVTEWYQQKKAVGGERVRQLDVAALCTHLQHVYAHRQHLALPIPMTDDLIPNTPMDDELEQEQEGMCVVRLDFIIPPALTQSAGNGCVFARSPDGWDYMFVCSEEFLVRSWVPCIDDLAQRCPFDLEFIVPTHLTRHPTTPTTTTTTTTTSPTTTTTAGNDKEQSKRDVHVVASGELVAQTLIQNGKKLVRYEFGAGLNASIRGITFACGPFDCLPISTGSDTQNTSTSTATDATLDQQHAPEQRKTQVFAFCLPGKASWTQATLSDITPKIFDFFTQYIGVSFPSPSLKLVFLPSLYRAVMSASGLALVSSALLHPGNINSTTTPTTIPTETALPTATEKPVIDQHIPTRLELARIIAAQYFGQYIFPRDEWADSWLVVGISGYLSGLFCRRVCGFNEYKFRMKKDMERISAMEDQERRPALVPLKNGDEKSALLEEFDPEDAVTKLTYEEALSDEFIRVKAPVVIYMLERYLGRVMIQKVINKIVVSGISGDLPSGLGTNYFLKLCKKVSGKETRYFAAQWIFTSGVPHIRFTHHFSRKKNIIELRIVQDHQHYPMYRGNLTIRVHEPDGTFDHVVRLEDKTHSFDLNYHTKYKRLRTNKKQQMLAERMEVEKMEQEMASGLLPPPGTELDEAMNAMDAQLSGELKKAKWRETDEEAQLIHSPVTWIRIDPDLELLLDISFEQTEYMESQQLMKDKDVVAQYEAIKRLQRKRTEKSMAVLLQCVVDVRMFVRVRMEAVLALARSVGMVDLEKLYARVDESGGAGLTAEERAAKIAIEYLFMVYSKKFCIHSSAADGPNVMTSVLVPRRNDFKVFSEYYIQRTIPESLALLRTTRGLGLERVQRFLLGLVKYNDNSANGYDDSAYLAGLVVAMGTAFLPDLGVVGMYRAPRATLHSPLGGNGAADDGGAGGVMYSPLFLEALAEIDRHLFLETQVPTYHNQVASACLQVLHMWKLAKILPASHQTLKPFLLFARPGNFMDIRLVAIDALTTMGWHHEPVRAFLIELIRGEKCPLVRAFVVDRTVRMVGLMREYLNKHAEEKEREKAGQFSSGSASGQKKVVLDVEDLAAGLDDRGVGASSSGQQIARVKTEYELVDEFFKRTDIRDALLQILLQDSSADLRIKRSILTLLDWYTIEVQEAPEPVELPKLKISLKPDILEAQKRAFGSDDEEQRPVKKIKLPSYHASPEHGAPPLVPPPALAQQALPKPKIRLSIVKPPPEPERVPTPAPKEPTPPPPIVQPLNEADLKRAQSIIDQMKKHPHITPFLYPVDQRVFFDYTNFVKQPIDMSTIQQKLDEGKYDSVAELVKDVRLIFQNCRVYNQEGSAINVQANKLEAYLDAIVGSGSRVAVQSPAPRDVPATTEPVIVGEGAVQAESVLPESQQQPAVATKAEQVAIDALTEIQQVQVVDPLAIPPPVELNRGGLSEFEWNAAHKMITKLSSLPLAYFFLVPVDPIRDGVPDYLDIVKRPMDLGTIQTKLETGEYQTIDQFEFDTELVLRNCFTYNKNQKTLVNQAARQLERQWRKDWYRAETVKNTILPAEQKIIVDLLGTLKAHPLATVFSTPVDWQTLGLFDYPKIIRRPMDLGTVSSKLAQFEYKSVRGFESDVRLVFRNCCKYNAKGSDIHQWALNLEREFDQLMTREGYALHH